MIHFPTRTVRRYEPAALDRLIGEVDRRRLRRAAGERPRLVRGTVVPFRQADR